jgi:hypothetical protein
MLNSDQLVTRLLSSGLARPEEIVPCSDKEIHHIEKTVRVSLPAAYKEFLRVAGKKAGCLFADVDVGVFFPGVLDLTESCARILSEWEGDSLRLPENAFVFANRYGEQFMFFVCDQMSEDPPVFFYHEDRHYFDKISESVWQVIETELNKWEAFRRDFPDSPYWKTLAQRGRC